jgi:hypothetical protein
MAPTMNATDGTYDIDSAVIAPTREATPARIVR